MEQSCIRSLAQTTTVSPPASEPSFSAPSSREAPGPTSMAPTTEPCPAGAQATRTTDTHRRCHSRLPQHPPAPRALLRMLLEMTFYSLSQLFNTLFTLTFYLLPFILPEKMPKKFISEVKESTLRNTRQYPDPFIAAFFSQQIIWGLLLWVRPRAAPGLTVYLQMLESKLPPGTESRPHRSFQNRTKLQTQNREDSQPQGPEPSPVSSWAAPKATDDSVQS